MKARLRERGRERARACGVIFSNAPTACYMQFWVSSRFQKQNKGASDDGGTEKPMELEMSKGPECQTAPGTGSWTPWTD